MSYGGETLSHEVHLFGCPASTTMHHLTTEKGILCRTTAVPLVSSRWQCHSVFQFLYGPPIFFFFVSSVSLVGETLAVFHRHVNRPEVLQLTRAQSAKREYTHYVDCWCKKMVCFPTLPQTFNPQVDKFRYRPLVLFYCLDRTFVLCIGVFLSVCPVSASVRWSQHRAECLEEGNIYSVGDVQRPCRNAAECIKHASVRFPRTVAEWTRVHF